MSDKRNKDNDRYTQEAYSKACDYLKSEKKAQEWFHNNNPLLGGESPLSMIGKHKGRELNRFMDELRGVRK